MNRIIPAAALAALLSTACGVAAGTAEEHPSSNEVTGIVQVLAQGTRSETVVLEETLTGDRYSLVGDVARELVPLAGSTVIVTAVPTGEGWTIRPEYPRLLVLDYIETSEAGGEDTQDY